MSGDTVTVASGGTASNVVLNGSTETVLSGGLAITTTVNVDSLQTVSSGGIASLTTVDAGEQDVLDGGTASTTTVTDGGSVLVYSGSSVTGITVSDSGSFLLGGTAAGTVVDGGTEYVFSGGVDIGATVSDGGVAVVYSGGTISAVTVAGSGTLDIQDGSTASGSIVFSGSDAMLVVEGTSGPSAAISGFSDGDTIDLTVTIYSTVDSITLLSGNLLQVVDAQGTTLDLQLEPAANEAGDTFSLSDDGDGGVDVTVTTGGETPCYCAGTRIATPDGEVPVEALRVGDHVLTPRSGGSAPVRWLGQRTVDLRGHPSPESVWPIRVRAGAFAPGVPCRDLRVSPGHGLYLDGVLIQAERLVNGITVLQEAPERVTYWHVELDAHDVLLADGAPAESYLDTGNRTAFVDGGAFLELHPDFRPKHWQETCLPLVQDGPLLDAAKARLLTRALETFGATTTQDAGLHMLVDGKIVLPAVVEGEWVRFRLPLAGQEIRLASRIWVPAQLLSASTDTRCLGVCVRQLLLDGHTLPLNDPGLSEGWDKLEWDAAGPQRWTRGCASVPQGATEIDVQLTGYVVYWRSQCPSPETAMKQVFSKQHTECPVPPGMHPYDLRAPISTADAWSGRSRGAG